MLYLGGNPILIATLDLAHLLEAPNLKLLMQQVEVALHEEERQRQAFYDWIVDPRRQLIEQYNLGTDLKCLPLKIPVKLTTKLKASCYQVFEFQYTLGSTNRLAMKRF